jgi:hypothetical protein
MQPTGSRLILYGDKEAEFSLYDVADIHFMNRGCAKHVLERDMSRISKDPFSFWALGGDYCDFIDRDDSRFDPECVDEDMRVNDMAELASWGVRGVMKFLLPIKDKCLGAAMGNHEKKYMTCKAQADVHPAVCIGLESQDLKYSGWFDIYFENRKAFKGCQLIKNPKPEQVRQPGQVRLRVMVHHGFSAAATSGGRINALKKALDMVNDADLIMLGHMHEQIGKTNVRIGVDETCQVLTAKSSLGLITGTYLRTYATNQTGYGEMRGYPPTTLGATRAVFCPSARTLTVENRADEIGLTF